MAKKYLTVLDHSGYSIPFEREWLSNGNYTIKLLSQNPKDNEDNCIVTLTDIYYAYSIDLEFHERLVTLG